MGHPGARWQEGCPGSQTRRMELRSDSNPENPLLIALVSERCVCLSPAPPGFSVTNSQGSGVLPVMGSLQGITVPALKSSRPSLSLPQPFGWLHSPASAEDNDYSPLKSPSAVLGLLTKQRAQGTLPCLFLDFPQCRHTDGGQRLTVWD